VKIRSLPDGPEYEDDRTIATLKLMNYLKQTQRSDTYVKYVHLLCEQHLNNGNFIEAGHTLLMHISMLLWSDDKLEAKQGFPSETSTARKSRLMLRAIDYFDQGKCWENAIGLCKELSDVYETNLYDYTKLSDVLRRQAAFYEKITGTERLYSYYYRVGFYGKGFPASLQGKEFVYRGFELERVMEFTSRIQAKFPNAEILKSNKAPEKDILDSDRQHIQIVQVAPVPSEDVKVKFANRNVSARVSDYYANNNINTFKYNIPLKRDKTKKGVNEFADLWIAETYLTTHYSFPTILRRSEVIKRWEVVKHPIEIAIETCDSKNKELSIFVKQFGGPDSKESSQSFTMTLSGVIDAAVNGGVKNYKEAFFTQVYKDSNPDKVNSNDEKIEALKKAMQEQEKIIETALKIHDKICQPQMRALHDHMLEMLDRFKEEMARKIK